MIGNHRRVNGGFTMGNPTTNVRLYGTEEQVPDPIVLRAGKLTAELDAGNLRYIRLDGIELIRAVSYIVRDKDWGTYNPTISKLDVKETAEGFTVQYDAEVRDSQQSFRYSAVIKGSSDGRLSFAATGEALSDFLTNRTGFVVLHPIDGVAGHPVQVEHVDGRKVDSAFPEIIDPLQPMMDLRALTHEPVPGLKVTCRMEGDTFEMEDQRNWTDASYKTYVRPLALPWPYKLEQGSTLEQQVTLEVTGSPSQPRNRKQGTATVSVGDPMGTVPPLGIGLEPELVAATQQRVAELSAARPHHLVCHFDPRQGHGKAELARAADLARSLGCEAWLEAVVPSVEGFASDIETLGQLVAEIGAPFVCVFLSPAPDLKCTLPGSPWPPCPPLEEVYKIGRAAFPKARLGGGMFSYFTELNRKRPPTDLLDIVTFTTSGLVHAGDDRSATEGLESLPYIAKSVREIAKGKPYHVGPSALGMRANPYGEAPMDNPDNIRQAMNRMDPRQRGLLGAAWNLGYAAHFAKGGAQAISLGGGVGPFGLVHAPMPYAQPYFDEAEGFYPVFHVFRGLAGKRGAVLLDTHCDSQRDVQAIALEGDNGRELWVANLLSESRTLVLDNVAGLRRCARLDADSFVEASQDPEFMDRPGEAFDGDSAELGPYAVARFTA
ncbi:hypothetical protein [Aquibaculum sediminis]|uniref:hypothetical protein n=1 Tax=Aquibaculum sediminis TaxID=3231907 RepID=UPI003453D152